MVFLVTSWRKVGWGYIASSSMDDEAGCDIFALPVRQWLVLHDNNGSRNVNILKVGAISSQ